MASEAKSPDADLGVDTGQARAWFRLRFVRMVCWGVVCVLVMYGLSNLWLWSSWGTGMAEAELEKRSGQEWEVASMSWSPWNGITFYNTRVLHTDEQHEATGEPLMSVEKIRVRPYWRKLARGQIHLQSVELESPAVTVSLEMLSTLASRTVHPEEPKIVLAKPQPTPDPPRQDPKPNPAEDKKPKPVKEDPQPPASRPQVVAKKRIPAGQPLHLKITNASFNLVAASEPVKVLSIQGLDYEHVLLGEDSDGTVSISSLKILDLWESRDLEQEISWRRPYLEIGEQEVEIGEVGAKVKAKLGVGKNMTGRFPFLFNFELDRQKIEPSQLPASFGTEMSADAVVARLRISGFLQQPDSWRADGVVAAENLVLDDLRGMNHVLFDEAYLPLVLRQGTLQWARARLMSEDMSIMGNGMLSMRDGHLSVTRLVVSPEVASLFNDRIVRLGIVDEQDPWWYDLDTPDRKVRDLVIHGPLLEPQIDAGKEHAWIPVFLIIDALHEPSKSETGTEKQRAKPIPLSPKTTK